MSLAELNSDVDLKPHAELRCQQALKLNAYNEQACILLTELLMVKRRAGKSD